MKRTPKQIISEIKKDNLEPDKKNYTFRLNIELMTAFEKICDKNDIRPTSVLTELIKDFCKFGPH